MINAQDVDVSYFADEAMGMLGILRFSADGSKCEIQYYSPYHGSSYHPSNQEMRSLTLAVNATDVGGETTDPEQGGSGDTTDDPTKDPDKEPTGDVTDAPSTEPAEDSSILPWIIGGVAVVAVLAVAIIVFKKKKK